MIDQRIMLLIANVLTFSLALWLGLYLLARNFKDPRMRFSGLALAAYACFLAFDLLMIFTPNSTSRMLANFRWALLVFQALFWLGALIYLLPERPVRIHPNWIILYGLLQAPILFYRNYSSYQNPDYQPQRVDVTAIILPFILTLGLPLAAALITVIRAWLKTDRETLPLRRLVGVILAATLFFGLSMGLVAFPLDWLPRYWVILGISFDLALLGVAIGVFDALDQGEAFLPDIRRSFVGALFNILLLGGPVLAVMASTSANFEILALLLVIITVAIVSQTHSDHIQTLLDRLAFYDAPNLQTARADLRAVSSAIPRISDTLDLNKLDETEFTRLTRQALSHLGDLTRLSASPLTRLPLVHQRLQARDAQDNSLERAIELKTILTEGIASLKPRGQGDFGKVGIWRHYNAVYYPYVVGLKPYSRRVSHSKLDPPVKEALEWFRTEVPERTLYNWQNTAARLIARNLRENN